MWMMEWRALSARIAAIFASAKFLNLGTLDPIYWDGNRTAAGTAIFENAKSTVESLEKLRDTALLPAQPRETVSTSFSPPGKNRTVRTANASKMAYFRH